MCVLTEKFIEDVVDEIMGASAQIAILRDTI